MSNISILSTDETRTGITTPSQFKPVSNDNKIESTLYYMVSSNYSYLIIIMCVRIVIWFQVSWAILWFYITNNKSL